MGTVNIKNREIKLSLWIELRVVVSRLTPPVLSTGFYIHLPSECMYTRWRTAASAARVHHHSRRVIPPMMTTCQRGRSLGATERLWDTRTDEDSTPAVMPSRWDLI